MNTNNSPAQIRFGCLIKINLMNHLTQKYHIIKKYLVEYVFD